MAYRPQQTSIMSTRARRLAAATAEGRSLALFDDNNSEPLALCPILKVVEEASIMFLTYAQYTVTRILTTHCDDKFPNSIQFALRVLRYLHGYIQDQQQLLRENLRVANLKGSNIIEE